MTNIVCKAAAGGGGTAVGLAAVIPLIGKLVDAYTRSKELDVQLAAIKAEHRLKMREFDIRERALEYEFQLQKQRFSKACAAIDATISTMHQQARLSRKKCHQLREHSNRLFTVIIAGDTPSETRQQLMVFWEKIQLAMGAENDRVLACITQGAAANRQLLGCYGQPSLSLPAGKEQEGN